jgi:hypothetical protein
MLTVLGRARLELRCRRGPAAAPVPPRHLVGGRHPGRLPLGSAALRHRVLPRRGCRQPGWHADRDLVLGAAIKANGAPSRLDIEFNVLAAVLPATVTFLLASRAWRALPPVRCA